MITLVPSVYDAATGAGDFGRMIRDAAYADALFIYNDNLDQSAAFLDQVDAGAVDPGSGACAAGGGNAAIRPFHCQSPPRAAGVPTGPSWATLADGKPAVDRALAYIAALVRTGRYARVIYSAMRASEPDVLGARIFSPPPALLRYVPAELKRIVNEVDGA